MNTHAEKTSENKSKAVANSLPKLQRDDGSTFQYADNRPEATAQRKLREEISKSPHVQQLKAYRKMANNSPQVKQLRAYQAMADNYRISPLSVVQNITDTAQLAAISKTVLNVIGENHSETGDGKREQYESSMLKDTTGSSNYWNENDFKVGAEPSWLKKDTRQKGDPTMLHLEFMMAKLGEFLRADRSGEAATPATHITLAQHKSRHLWTWNSFLYIMNNLTDSQFGDLTSDQVTALKGTKALCDKADEAVKKLTTRYETSNYVNINADYSTAVIYVESIIQALYGAQRTSGTVNDARDLSMHTAANAEATSKKGAWKIGEAHRATIDARVALGTYAPKSYNMVSKDDFDFQYAQWVSANHEKLK